MSSEANEVCKQRAKKTIAPEHIIDALKVITDETSYCHLSKIASWMSRPACT